MSNDKPVSSVTPKISTENPFNDKDITAAYFHKRRISINSVSAVILQIIMNKMIKTIETTCRKDSSPDDVKQNNFQSELDSGNKGEFSRVIKSLFHVDETKLQL